MTELLTEEAVQGEEGKTPTLVLIPLSEPEKRRAVTPRPAQQRSQKQARTDDLIFVH